MRPAPIVTTHAEQTIMNSIRRYPTLYSCGSSAVNSILLSSNYEWVNGQLIDTTEHLLTPEQLKFNVDYDDAYYIMIGRKYFNYLDPSGYSPLFKMPDNITPDWLEVCQRFCYDVLQLKPKYYKIMVKGYLLMLFGDGFYKHPDNMIKAEYERYVNNFLELRAKVKELAKNKGWKYMYTPMTKKRKAKLNKIAEDIITEVLAEEKLDKS